MHTRKNITGYYRVVKIRIGEITVLFNHVSTLYTAWRIDRGCSRMLCKTQFNTTATKWSKFMVVVASLFNLVISSFYHAGTWLLIYHDRWFQQNCSSLFVHQAMNSLFQHAWTSLSTTLFNNINICNKHCSSWPAQLCSSLSTGKNKLCVLTCSVHGLRW